MKKLLLLLGVLFLVTSTTHAEVISASYKVEFGVFGEIGIANATLTRDANSYEIDVELEATGISKTLSGNRKEHHVSKGHIENGVMISDLYQVMKSHGGKVTNKVYRPNHARKSVTKEYKRWRDGKLEKDETSTLNYYSEDDLLTLYFNLNNKIADKTMSNSYTFEAIGAEKQNGTVLVEIPSRSELPLFKEALGSDDSGWYARAIINQNIFSSDKGELLLRIGQDGITERAVLKDLIFFGDIRAIRIQ